MLRKASSFNLGAIVLGLGFLYLPILILVIYSFNASRLVTVWGGWSTRWYVELAHDGAEISDLRPPSDRLTVLALGSTTATLIVEQELTSPLQLRESEQLRQEVVVMCPGPAVQHEHRRPTLATVLHPVQRNVCGPSYAVRRG